jgi:rhodanese-related sulfurtransferase
MYKTIHSSDLEKLIQNKDVHVVDVREQDEYDMGHIPGVSHLPLSGFPENIHELDKDKKHYLVCASGGRSGMASDYLDEAGFDVVNVDGGMNQWRGEIE